jgi:hypothetical protein
MKFFAYAAWKINHMIKNVNYLLSKFKFSILSIFNWSYIEAYSKIRSILRYWQWDCLEIKIYNLKFQFLVINLETKVPKFPKFPKFYLIT